MDDDSPKIDSFEGESFLPPPPESGRFKRVIAGRYHLTREIARGGMGILWLTWDARLERYVAVKFMNLTRTPEEEDNRRFALEAKAEAQLGGETEHVVKVLDYGIDNGTRYIIMEFLIGEDLGARLEKTRRLSAEALAPMVRQIASALKTAHRRNLIHRDIKPANIFLCQRDDEERVKILDFGIVKALGTTPNTITGKLLGTPLYMAPEHFTDNPIDLRTDLWSLGVVLYQALTGRPPFSFDGWSMMKLASAICDAPIPLPSTVAPDLPESVDAFFSRALSRSPEGRFQSAEELARAFAGLARMPMGPLSTIPPVAPDLSSADTLEQPDADTKPATGEG